MSLQTLRKSPRLSRGFTLVELLVVIAIIGILIGMLLPAVQQVREAARRTQCSNKIRQVSLAMHNYESGYMKFPPGSFRNGQFGRDSWSWYSFVLPYMEMNNAFDELDMTLRINGPDSLIRTGAPPFARAQLNSEMLCPADRHIIQEEGIANWQNALHNYVVCYGSSNYNSGTPWNVVDGYEGVAGVFVPEQSAKMGDITDGTSNTLFVSEIITPERADVWGALGRTQVAMGAGFTGFLTPNANADDRLNRAHTLLTPGLGPRSVAPHPDWDWGANVVAARSLHPGGVNVSYADCSVRFQANDVDVFVWRALAGRNDRIVVSVQ